MSLPLYTRCVSKDEPQREGIKEGVGISVYSGPHCAVRIYTKGF